MPAPASQVYANDRSGNLWVLNPSTLAGTSYSFPEGAANAAIAFDNTNTYNVFLPGVYSGASVDMVVFSAQSLAEATGSPLSMPSSSFRPLQAAYDSTNNRLYVADFAAGLTVWNTATLTQVGSMLTPGTGTIQTQGVAYNPSTNLIYTCCQSSTGQDQLAVYNASTLAQVTGSPFAVNSLMLTNSYTSIAYDATNNHILITGNNPQGGLTVLNASTYAPISGSPFNTGGTDARGLAVANGNVYICNFGSNNLGILTASTLVAPTGSPYATGASPNAVAVDATQVYVTNFNGTAGALSVFTASSMLPITGSPFNPNNQFVGIAVGP
jgi:DNA-binding beta-propeller fold protein YncE